MTTAPQVHDVPVSFRCRVRASLGVRRASSCDEPRCESFISVVWEASQRGGRQPPVLQHCL